MNYACIITWRKSLYLLLFLNQKVYQESIKIGNGLYMHTVHASIIFYLMFDFFVLERRNGWSFAQSGLWSVGDRKQTVFRKDWPEEHRFIGAEADVH